MLALKTFEQQHRNTKSIWSNRHPQSLFLFSRKTIYLPLVDTLVVIFGDQVYPNSFFLDPATPSEIESEILLTPLNKVYGLYSCPILILKGANHFVSATLAEIMNMSVQTGVYPSKLKHAKVSPVYKTGDRTEPGNYRPISLLSVFNRLFKRLMHKRLTAFIEKKNTFFIMHSMVSEQTVLLSRQFWILSTEYKVIWTPVCILYYYANWVTTVYVELSMIGSRRIWLIGPRLLNLKLAFLAKGK